MGRVARYLTLLHDKQSEQRPLFKQIFMSRILGITKEISFLHTQ